MTVEESHHCDFANILITNFNIITLLCTNDHICAMHTFYNAQCVYVCIYIYIIIIFISYVCMYICICIFMCMYMYVCILIFDFFTYLGYLVNIIGYKWI